MCYLPLPFPSKDLTKVVSPKIFYEKLRKQSYFFACILPDYMGHESLKEFWKNI